MPLMVSWRCVAGIVWKGTEPLWAAIYQTERLSFINKGPRVACCNVITIVMSNVWGSQSADQLVIVRVWWAAISPWWQGTYQQHIIPPEQSYPWPRLIMHCVSRGTLHGLMHPGDPGLCLGSDICLWCRDYCRGFLKIWRILNDNMNQPKCVIYFPNNNGGVQPWQTAVTAVIRRHGQEKRESETEGIE